MKLYIIISVCVLPLFGADSMIRLKFHIRKEDTLLQNMQRCSCNLLDMACPGKLRCFHKRLQDQMMQFQHL